MFLFGAVAIFASKSLLHSDRLCLATTLAFLVGILFVSFLYWGYNQDYGLPYWMPGQDDYKLEQDALECVHKNYFTPYDMANGDTYRFRSHNTKGYVVLLALMMRIGELFGGYSTLVPRIFNILALNLIGTLIVFCLKRRYDFSDNRLVKVYLAVTLFPNMLYISAHIYRDILVSLCIFGSYVVAKQLEGRRGSSIFWILLLVLITYSSYWLRAMSLVFIVGVVAIIFLFGKTASRRVTVGKFFVSILVLLVSGILVFYSGEDIDYYVSTYGTSISAGNSAFFSRIYSLPLFPLGLPLRLLAYLCSPFYYSTVFNPVIWFDSTTMFCQLLVSLGTVFLVSRYVYLPLAFKQDKESILIALYILLGISLSTSGYRHIVMVYPFFFLTISQGILCADPRSSIHRSYSRLSIVFGCLFVAAFCLLYLL